MIDQLLNWDTEVFVFFNGMGSARWDTFWLTYTSTLVWVPFYGVLLYFVYRQMALRPFLATLILVALMVVVTDQASNLFKSGFQRLRPCHLPELIDRMRLVKSHCGGQYGFFSAHASNTMGVAILIGSILKDRFRYLIFILIAWALLMGYSRIYIGVHYPLDVLVGMLVGGLTGWGFYSLNGYVHKRL